MNSTQSMQPPSSLGGGNLGSLLKKRDNEGSSHDSSPSPPAANFKVYWLSEIKANARQESPLAKVEPLPA